MGEEFQKYTLEDFLDDANFCSWARYERSEMDGFYSKQLVKYPEQKEVFELAGELVRLFDDEKLITHPDRKLQIWRKINRVYHQDNKITKNYKLIFRYAAAIVLLFSFASLTWYFVSLTDEDDFFSSYRPQELTEMRLLLDNGDTINIQEEQAEIIYDHGGKQLIINDELVQKKKNTTNPVLNELTVPFGKQSKVVLSDLTEVWLNAGSRLIYPASFEGKNRKVKLQGEAYFKVYKDKSKPFIVETNNSSIEVLGTSFNVRAYPGEMAEETVLAEGSIRFNPGKTIFGKKLIMEPGQLVTVPNGDHSYTVSKVDVRDYTSWIDGVFVFHEESLASLLKRVSQFYNIEIVWMNDAENRKISGKLDLKDNYLQVLNALSLISNGVYSKENGKIYFRLK
ncbi:FecR family protein [Gaoshiqia sediminis]|uniref:FecR domain-containing protein n=1 Tax=Gaoshiqia sediminis TaxID=2986998 RepID=A0AA41Y984_9BACT|nr:FecR domain-containing protein [Gaoshiqia sediminis]MCW0483926.1 FecR domain-containing protein [Gaoshiqia sediminis]